MSVLGCWRQLTVQRVPCHQGVNAPDSLCQAIFRAHLCADGRSSLPHLCGSGEGDRTRQGGGRNLLGARRGGRYLACLRPWS